MKLLIKSLEDILSDKLTLVERGILITIMLLREKDSKITLAKCKTKISFQKNRDELIRLHESKLISWSGYDNAKKAIEQQKASPVILDILYFMNSLYRRNFGPTKERITPLTNLLKDFSVEDIKKVIANRYIVWKDNPDMCQYLVPETIFRRSKFIKYLDEVNYTKAGESFVSANKIDLKHGDEITQQIADNFSDNDLYTMLVIELDHDGTRITQGREIVKSGKDIKRLLKIRGGQEYKDFMLTYIQK
jgi:uncharacterized phage protein (TIGR02220 family)